LTAVVFVALIALFAWAANDWRAPWQGKPDRGPGWCAAHDVALKDCEKCDPALARGGTTVIRDHEPAEGECPNMVLRVKLAPGVADRIGLETFVAKKVKIDETIRANAETRYPPDRYARVAPRLPGVIREVKAILGQEVAGGTTLAVVESPAFGEAKGGYLQAISVQKLRQTAYESEKALHEKKISTIKELLAAEAALKEADLALNAARQKLASLGLASEQIDALKDAAPLLEVVAPFEGVVVDATAVPGESAGPDKPIFAVAYIEKMWASIDVYEVDLPRVEKDRKVTFTVEGLPQKFPGKVVAISGEVDDRTRTVRVFAELKNIRRFLKANMFGRAEIRVQDPEPRLLIPKAALQNDGECPFVFVSSNRTTFIPRKVELGGVYGNGYEITGGLSEDEVVVTTGGFLLKTEILRGQIGAG
jgi:cobalt-zinc-cadmium efflux system membrane fusion protein